MKLIMAMSRDGYLARDERDDMQWTGADDKRAFQLLTLSDGRPLLAGRTTYERLPPLPGRLVLPLSRSGLTLHSAAMMHPDAWLIGGPTVALEALRDGLVKRAFVHVVPFELRSGIIAGPLLSRLPHEGPEHRVWIGQTEVRIFTREQQWPAR